MRTSRLATAALGLASLVAVTAGCGETATGGKDPEVAGASESSGKHSLVGAPAPAFAFDSVNGKGKVDLAKLKGKLVLVDFWATWCEPCKKSFPKLQELNVKYKASGLVIVAMSQDDENQGLTEFGKTYGAEFPLGWDKDKTVAQRYKPPSMPSSFLVDKQGVVRFAHLGYHDGDEEKLEKEIKSLM